MKPIWLLLFSGIITWQACTSGTDPQNQESATLSAADSLRIRTAIDSLAAIADTTTAGKDTLLIRIAGLYQTLHNKDGWTATYWNLFAFYHGLKNYEAAYEVLNPAVRDIWWEPDSLAGRLYLVLGYSLRQLERNYAAGIYYEKARELSDRYGSVASANPAGPIYKTLANIKTRLGENEEAIKILEAGLYLLETDTTSGVKTANAITKSKIYADLGSAWQNDGRYDEALRQYEAGLEVLRKLRNVPEKAKKELAINTGLLLSNKASVLTLMNQLDAAEKAANEALKVLPADKGNYRFNTKTILAEIQEKKGNAAAAQQFRQAALALGKYAERRELGKLLIEMGWSEYRNLNYDSAAHYAQHALNLMYPNLPPDDIWKNPDPTLINPDPENTTAEALDLKGEAIWQQHRVQASDELLALADTTTALAIHMMENLRDVVVYESSKLNSARQSRQLFGRMLRILYARYEAGETPAAERAFTYAEKNKAVLLRQKIAADAAWRNAGIDDALIQEERDLKEQRANLLNELFERQVAVEASPDTIVSQVKRKIFQLEEQLRQLQKKVEEKYGLPPAGQNSQTATVSDVRKKLLRADEWWITYFTDSDSSQVYLVSIGKNDLRFVRKPYAEATVRNFLQLFNAQAQAENKSGDRALFAEFTTTARQLYLDLLAPALPEKPPAQLTLAPDGALALLPFDVLLYKPVSAGTQVYYDTLPYLVSVSQLRLAPSASLDLFYTQQERPKRRGPYIGFAPGYSGSVLGPVVSGSKVVDSAAVLFKGKAFTRSGAALDTFMHEAAGHAIIHFHGHAEASDSFPDYSWMAFTAGQSIAGIALPQDAARTLGRGPGRLPAAELAHCLFAHQVYQSRLDADLVLLSACETGLGKIAPGEGTLSLSRAFQAAGCPATVMSLWEVRDDATAKLMQAFLENIRDGQDKDEALANAKRHYLETTPDAFPYYWAGFVLTGKADPVRLSSPWWAGPVGWVLLLGGLVGIVFLGYRIYRRTQI